MLSKTNHCFFTLFFVFYAKATFENLCNDEVLYTIHNHFALTKCELVYNSNKCHVMTCQVMKSISNHLDVTHIKYFCTISINKATKLEMLIVTKIRLLVMVFIAQIIPFFEANKSNVHC